MRGCKYRQRLHTLGYGTGMRKKGLNDLREQLRCSRSCPQSSKRPKRSAVLDAGMRITGEKTTFGQEVEREQKHTTGQKRKQPGKRSPVQVQRKKDLSLLMRCSYVAAYQERCELLLILLPLTGHRRLEKRGDELQRLPSSHTCVVYCSRTLNTSLLCLVH